MTKESTCSVNWHLFPADPEPVAETKCKCGAKTWGEDEFGKMILEAKAKRARGEQD